MERAWLGAAVTVQARGEAGHLSSHKDRGTPSNSVGVWFLPGLSARRARGCSDKAWPIPGGVRWPSRAHGGPLNGGYHGALRSPDAHRETLCPPDAPGRALGSTQAGTRWRNLDSPAPPPPSQGTPSPRSSVSSRLLPAPPVVECGVGDTCTRHEARTGDKCQQRLGTSCAPMAPGAWAPASSGPVWQKAQPPTSHHHPATIGPSAVPFSLF